MHTDKKWYRISIYTLKKNNDDDSEQISKRISKVRIVIRTNPIFSKWSPTYENIMAVTKWLKDVQEHVLIAENALCLWIIDTGPANVRCLYFYFHSNPRHHDNSIQSIIYKQLS